MPALARPGRRARDLPWHERRVLARLDRGRRLDRSVGQGRACRRSRPGRRRSERAGRPPPPGRRACPPALAQRGVRRARLRAARPLRHRDLQQARRHPPRGGRPHRRRRRRRGAYSTDVGLTAVPARVVFLRGINLGSRNRLAMPELREALSDAGFDDVRTYLQSGNVVLSSRASPATVTRRCEEAIAERFGLDVAVVVRTRDELAEVVRRNPLGDVAKDPKRYQVSFLDAEPDPGLVDKLAEAADARERFEVIGREIYAWHPAGAARSKLWALLAGTGLGVTATARNWTTVTKVLVLAGGDT